VRGQYLTTAANALHHAVERRVLAIDWIVRIHQVFLRGHLIGARLAVADRCAIRHQLVVRVRRWRCGWIWRTSRLRNRHRSVDQGQQRYRRDQLSHDGSPELGPPHDYGNGKLGHKVRQASRFVQMLKRRSTWRFPVARLRTLSRSKAPDRSEALQRQRGTSALPSASARPHGALKLGGRNPCSPNRQRRMLANCHSAGSSPVTHTPPCGVATTRRPRLGSAVGRR
jgi:hypothetical protein